MSDLIFQRQIIMLGDCLLRLAELPPDSIDAVVTSPPFNLKIKYNSYSDNLPRDTYLHWLERVGHALARVMKPSASLFLNIGSSNIDPWLPFDVGQAFRSLFYLQNHIVWIKSISIGDDTVGHFKPINSARYLNHNHETMFHFTKTGHVPIDRLAAGVPFKDKSNIARRQHAQDKRCAGNAWFIPYDTVQRKSEKFDHPAGFPVALVKRCLQLVGAGVVLDPFLGAGTTLVAAVELGWSGFGIELDPIYAATALRRVRLAGGVSDAPDQGDLPLADATGDGFLQ